MKGPLFGARSGLMTSLKKPRWGPEIGGKIWWGLAQVVATLLAAVVLLLAGPLSLLSMVLLFEYNFGSLTDLFRLWCSVGIPCSVFVGYMVFSLHKTWVTFFSSVVASIAGFASLCWVGLLFWHVGNVFFHR